MMERLDVGRIQALPEIPRDPQLDAIVTAIRQGIEERLQEIVPVLEAHGLHAHIGPTRAEWEQAGDFFRKDEIRIRVEQRYKLCDEEHPKSDAGG